MTQPTYVTLEKPVFIQAKHEFTQTELLELSSQLARDTKEAQTVDNNRKQIASQFKAQADAIDAKLQLNAEKLTSGYEMRETKCRVTLYPKDGKKEFYRADDGTLVSRVDMNQSDFQLTLDDAKDREAEDHGKATTEDVVPDNGE